MTFEADHQVEIEASSCSFPGCAKGKVSVLLHVCQAEPEILGRCLIDSPNRVE